jgi:hypothetical protein
MLLDGRVTLAELQERVAFYEGTRRRGLPLFEAMVKERSDTAWQPSESMLEDELRAMLRLVARRPEVVWQPDLPWRPHTQERLDAFLPHYGVIVEADGRARHARVRDFDRDRWRDSEAIAHGLQPMRFTWVHLTRRRAACASLVDGALAHPRRVPAA